VEELQRHIKKLKSNYDDIINQNIVNDATDSNQAYDIEASP
jgi:hypothetical protein